MEQAEAASQLPLMKPEIAATGDLRVDAAIQRLADTAELPVAEQVEVFDEVHRRLQDVLAEAHG